MLGIGLREHHEFDVGRIAPEPPEVRVEVFDLVRREREAEFAVRALERGAAVRVERDRRERPRRHVDEQTRRVGEIGEYGFDHAVVDERQERGPILRDASGAPALLRTRYAMPRSMRATADRPQLRAMSVAFDDHGEIVPGRGTTSRSAPSMRASAAGSGP